MSYALDNHANQLNPNNDVYYQSRGLDGRPDDWEENISNSSNSNNDYYYTSEEDNNYYFSDTDDEDTYKKFSNVKPQNKKYYQTKIHIRHIFDRKTLYQGSFSPKYNIPKINYEYKCKLVKCYDGSNYHKPINSINQEDFILYKFSFSKLSKEIKKNKDISIKYVFNYNSCNSESYILLNSKEVKILKQTSLLIFKELSKIFDKELKYNKIIEKIKKYRYYPYNFLNLKKDIYGDSQEGDYVWKEKDNIMKFFKYNNLSLLKESSIKKRGIYHSEVRSPDLCDYIEKHKYGSGHWDPPSFNEWDFLIIPSEKIINNFTNKIHNNCNKKNIFENLNSLKNEHVSNRIKRNYISNNDYLIGLQSSPRFTNFLKDIYPCLLLYITKKGEINLVNENNNKIVYKFKLPKEYTKYEITNTCLLENDNILIELNENLLLEFNITTSNLKSFMYEPPKPILSDEEIKLKNIESILRECNLNSKQKLLQVKKVIEV